MTRPNDGAHQSILDVFRQAFPVLLDPNHTADTLLPLIQQVKEHLYNRDFDAAFGKADYLNAYAARWSAARAMGYVDVFEEVTPHFQTDCAKIVCVGGGAGAELVAFAAVSLPSPVCIYAVDIADWSAVVETITQAIRGSNLRTDSTTFLQADVLSSRPELSTWYGQADLVTFAFTLNELYAASLPKTQKLLLDLTAQVKSGTLLLIVDSAGSYSTVKLGDRERKYPMQWLLERTLLETAPEVFGNGKTEEWKVLQSTSSKWFRQPPSLKYPIPLEDMRYQVHLFQRC